MAEISAFPGISSRRWWSVVWWSAGALAIPAVVYRKENMPMPIRVVIHMGSGCVIYTLVACWVGWIDLSAGLWQGIGMIAAQLAAAFLIWFFFLLLNAGKRKR